MRKIVVKFNKLKDIENLKKIMRNVYASSSDHLPDIAKFHLGDKIFMLNQVDKAELYIQDLRYVIGNMLKTLYYKAMFLQWITS